MPIIIPNATVTQGNDPYKYAHMLYRLDLYASTAARPREIAIEKYRTSQESTLVQVYELPGYGIIYVVTSITDSRRPTQRVLLQAGSIIEIDPTFSFVRNPDVVSQFPKFAGSVTATLAQSSLHYLLHELALLAHR